MQNPAPVSEDTKRARKPWSDSLSASPQIKREWGGGWGGHIAQPGLATEAILAENNPPGDTLLRFLIGGGQPPVRRILPIPMKAIKGVNNASGSPVHNLEPEG